MTRSKWHIWVNAPTMVWFGALVAVSVLHRDITGSGWIMLHLLFLGAASNAILVWSAYFSETLLRIPPQVLSRRGQIWRLIAVNVGTLGVIAGRMLPETWLVAVGALGIMAAVADHARVLILAKRRAQLARFSFIVNYYIAAAGFFLIGAALGGLMGISAVNDGSVLVAHVSVNLLGWIGLTVAGTLPTLLPTVIRTQMATGTEGALRRSFGALIGGLATVCVATVAGWSLVATFGLIIYLAGWAILLRPLIPLLRHRRVLSFAASSLIAGMVWFVVTSAAWAVVMATSPSWAQTADQTRSLAGVFAAGFLTQVLLGALTYLLPVVLGGGPAAVRSSIHTLERGAWTRLTVANVGLMVFFLPVPSLVRVVTSVVVLVAYASFLPLVLIAVWRRLRPLQAQDPGPESSVMMDARLLVTRTLGGVIAGFSIVVLAVVAALSLSPATTGQLAASSANPAEATGETTVIAMEAGDMWFRPNRIDVPVGNRLILEVTNVDSNVHDVVLSNGVSSGRLAPGDTAQVDAGVISSDLSGICSIVGHAAMGMTFDIIATGASSSSAGIASESHHTLETDSESATIDFRANAPADFQAVDARLAPAPNTRVHELTLRATELQREVAPGVAQNMWTFNGQVPGPTLRGRVGDVFDITFINDGTIGHSIDFHAGSLAPDRPMRTIAPGESLQYTFTAERSGIWMYHCGTMPMSAHIANGMFGAVIIDPPDLPAVSAEYLLIQSELYLGPPGGEVDFTKLDDQQPDAVVFNGYVNQYVYQPLSARVGERIRIWVLDAGPNRPSSFHVIGSQFDEVYFEGATLLSAKQGASGGSQSLALAAAQGGYVEMTLPEAGTYPFVSHIMWDAEHGAKGLIRAE